MRTSKLKGPLGLVLATGLVGGLVLGPVTAASAASGGVVNCGALKVNVQSNASGRINHKEGVTVLGSWNNGGSYVYRNSSSGKKSVPSWSAYLSGVGGNILWGNTHCALT